MLEEPACSNPGHSRVAAFVLHKQPARTFQEQLHPPTHMALIGDGFFFSLPLQSHVQSCYFSLLCVYLDGCILTLLTEPCQPQASSSRASASTNDSDLSGARSAKHLLPSLPSPPQAAAHTAVLGR